MKGGDITSPKDNHKKMQEMAHYSDAQREKAIDNNDP